MIGRTIAGYRIIQRLGAGGMGEVFLAEDPALGRKVALKFLSERLLDSPTARRRFILEPKAAAGLDSPFICKIYDTGEVEGRPFIVMEFVEGTTLRARLSGGPMRIDEALWAAREMAEALESAHRQGIVHRDLKPANILLTPDGHVKVLDFGLAKTVPAASSVASDSTVSAADVGDDDLTGSGIALGTSGYIAPEVLEGHPASRQSDTFSFGVVLYEMVTGVHPFLRKSKGETARAILNEDPPPISRHVSGTPDLLQHTLNRMLARDPGMRFHSVREVRNNLIELQSGARPSLPASLRTRASGVWRNRTTRGALAGLLAIALGLGMTQRHRLGGESSAPPGNVATASIAVLPFKDMSTEGDQEYFCDGMAEQIISTLSEIPDLQVMSRTSAFAFKGRSEDVRQIARQLNVAKILEGSVRKSGNRLRVTVQLVNASDGFESWSRSYDRDVTDVLAVQDEIAQQVATALDLRATQTLGFPASRHHEPDPEAYNLYLRGRYLWNQRTPKSLETALRLFEQAVEKDPEFAPAYVGIADTHNVLQVYKGVASLQATRAARDAITKALSLDATLAEAHGTYGVLNTRAWEWTEAERQYRWALRLKPGNATIRCWFAQLLAMRGRGPEAITESRRAQVLDPLSPYANTVYGTILYLTREYDEAKRQVSATLELDPHYHLAYETLAYIHAAEGNHEQALKAARTEAELAGDADTSVLLGYVCGRSGQRDEAVQILRRLERRWADGTGSAGRIAVVNAGLGSDDAALEWLDKARLEHDIWITQLAIDPVFDHLRSTAGFKKLLSEVGLPVLLTVPTAYR